MSYKHVGTIFSYTPMEFILVLSPNIGLVLASPVWMGDDSIWTVGVNSWNIKHEDTVECLYGW